MHNNRHSDLRLDQKYCLLRISTSNDLLSTLFAQTSYQNTNKYTQSLIVGLQQVEDVPKGMTNTLRDIC